MNRLRVNRFKGAGAVDPVMFSRTRHFSFAGPDGRLAIESAAIGSRGLKVFTVRSTGHEVALTEDTHVNVLVPVRGTLGVATTARDYAASPGSFLVFPPNERRTVVRPDGSGVYEALVLALPCAGQEGGRPGLSRPVGVATTGLARALVDEATRLLSLLRDGAPAGEPHGGEAAGEGSWPALAAARIETLLDVVLSEACPPVSRRGGAAGSPSQLRRVEEFIRLHVGQPLRMSAVAAAAGLSVRGLQATFQRHRGETPLQFLNRLRLEDVRVRLLNGHPGDRVTDVALLMGFTHLGRFSQIYARRFGESPSTTLRRAQSG